MDHRAGAPADEAPPAAANSPREAGEAPGGVAAAARAAAPDPDPTPVLTDAEGKALPQTEDRPRGDSPALFAGAERLFEAIVKDDAEVALPFFFPVVAYEQVKDIAKPARDWEWRLVSAFKRNVHEYHRALGKDREACRFLRIEVPEQGIQWMKPGSEGNRLGYFRVLRSKLVYQDAQGQERSLEITSLISWRGEWYVVHLHGFR